jgi:hypothetical protein
MSYDFYIDKVCSHTIVDEVCLLNSETGDSFAFARRPSTYDCRITIDGVVVPPGGLFSKAEIVCGKSEPYRIIAGQNDLILLQIGNDTPVQIGLPPGHAVSAKTLATFLSNYTSDLVFTAENGRLVIRTPTPVNGSAFTLADPRWTDKTASLISTSRVQGAYKLLGVTPGKVGAGRKLLPGFKVILNPAAYLEEWIVRFDSPIRNSSPAILVTYQTLAPFCGRCQGSRVEVDYTITGGAYDTVRNVDLLIQEFNKFLFTVKGSHWKWPWLGSNILNRIGGKADTGTSLASSFIALDVNSAFSVYQNIKRQQDIGFPGQNVTDAEYPQSLGQFAVNVMDDPTSYFATFNIYSRSSEPLQITRTISLPNPYQLTSSPAQLLQSAARGFQLMG